MKVQVLAPAMEHCEEADLHAQTSAGQGEQSLGGGTKQEVENNLLVVEGDGGDGFGKREHHVEIVSGQQFCLACLQPLLACLALAFGAVAIAAGTIADMRVLAVVAPFHHTAQQRSAALIRP